MMGVPRSGKSTHRSVRKGGVGVALFVVATPHSQLTLKRGGCKNAAVALTGTSIIAACAGEIRESGRNCYGGGQGNWARHRRAAGKRGSARCLRQSHANKCGTNS